MEASKENRNTKIRWTLWLLLTFQVWMEFCIINFKKPEERMGKR